MAHQAKQLLIFDSLAVAAKQKNCEFFGGHATNLQFVPGGGKSRVWLLVHKILLTIHMHVKRTKDDIVMPQATVEQCLEPIHVSGVYEEKTVRFVDKKVQETFGVGHCPN